MSGPAYACNGEPVTRDAFYAMACDPRRSIAVEACAGAGKTWMLVSRMVRALLDGTLPHEILAITFTRKAAGEMRARLDEWLQTFARQDAAKLVGELTARGCTVEQAQAQAQALQTLAQRVLDAGRPVQIRTFHSWFAALVREAPLAVLDRLGLPAQYELLEDDADAVAACWPRFLQAVLDDEQAHADFQALVRSQGRHVTQQALQSALARRMEFAIADKAGVVDASVDAFDERYPWLKGLHHPCEWLDQPAVRERWLGWARSLGAEKNKTPRTAASAIEQAFAQPDVQQRFEQLRAALFVKDEDRLRQHLPPYVAAQEAEAELQTLCRAVHQHEGWLHHQQMARLLRLLMRKYAALKRERGWLDMTDLERAAHELLRDPVISGWVHERLDARVSQLLIDEFQDTNPVQWQALRSWLEGYAGAGHSLPVFIVGDPKQSIYRFRRAEPQVFEAAKAFIREGLGGVVLSCDHTRRNAQAVLATVNAVMGEAAPGDAYPGFRVHTTESVEVGEALALPQMLRDEAWTEGQGDDVPQPQGSASSWRDSLTTPRELDEDSLRLRECRQVARWIAARIAQGDQPGDFMVLARQRERLDSMQQALRELHLPCERTERSQLADALEVQDIVALLDVLVSPTHNLSLAQVLRSPLFGVSDDVLVRLAEAQEAAQEAAQQASWEASRKAASDASPGASGDAAWFDLLDAARCVAADGRSIGEVLRRWQAWANRLPPHDALSFIFRDGDVLARYAAEVPASQCDAVLARLRGVLAATLALDGGRYLTPYAWVRQLRAQALRAPAAEPAGAVQRGAVSLLTVHGAKGLEATVVIVLDADAPPPRGDAWGACIQWPGYDAHPRRFAFCASWKKPPPSLVELVQAEQAAQAREELNMLYVAMTRAERTLVFSSSQPHRPPDRSAWVRVLPHVQADVMVVEPTSPSGPAASEAKAMVSALTAAPAVAGLWVLPEFQPGLCASVQATAATAGATDADAATDAASDRLSRIGQAMHRLLEWRPTGTAGVLSWTAEQFRRLARDFDLSADEVAQARDAAQRILQGQGAWAWDASVVNKAESEVELLHAGALLRIDRLVRRRDNGHWWVLDHKSSAQPQQDAALCAQLRTYRDAVKASLALSAAGSADSGRADPGGEPVVRCAFLSATGALIELG